MTTSPDTSTVFDATTTDATTTDATTTDATTTDTRMEATLTPTTTTDDDRAPTGRVGTWNVIRGEWIKFWSVRSTRVTLLAAGVGRRGSSE